MPNCTSASRLMMSTQSTAAIENREVPSNSKVTDLVTRVAVAFNAIDYFIASLLNEEPTNNPPEQLTEACYKKAVPYMEYLPAQKEMFADSRKGNCRDLQGETAYSTNRA